MANWGARIVTKDIAGCPLHVFQSGPTSIGVALAAGRKWGERVFIVYGERRITLNKLLAAVSRTAEHQKTLGVAPMRPSAILAANSPEWLWGFLGACKITGDRGAWWAAEGDLAERLNEDCTVEAFPNLAD